MATLLQKNLAKAIVENASAKRRKNKKELLVLAGYDETTAESIPGIIMEQVGVKQELMALGFNENSAKQVVQEIMLNPKVDANTRLKATDQVFKVHGSYARSDINVEVNIAGIISKYG